MSGFLTVALSLPTLLYTALLAAVVVYWLFVIVGAVDLDSADSALDGVGDAASHGLLESAGKVAGEKVGEVLGEKVGEVLGEKVAGAADAHFGMAKVDGVSGLLSDLKLRRAPVTVVGSLLVLFSWFFSFMGSKWLGGLGLEGALDVLSRAGVGLAAFVLSLPLTSLLIRPLAPLFSEVTTRAQETLIGKVCRLSTTRVDEKFGQAEVANGGAGLLISVVCEGPNSLKKGAEALIVGYDRKRQVYTIQPLAPLLEEAGVGQNDKQERQAALRELEIHDKS